MRHFTFLFFLLFGLSFTAQSQISIGAKADVTLTNITATDGGITASFDNKVGLQAGLVLETKLSESLALRPELLYFQKGAKLDFLGDDVTFSTNYLQIPVLVKFSPGTSGFFITGGPSVAYLLSASTKADGEKEVGELSGEDRLDFSVNLGAGMEFGNQDASRFFVEVRYMHGLKNISGDTETKTTSKGFGLSAGIFF